MPSSKLKNGIRCVLGLHRPIDVVVQNGQVAGISAAEFVDVLSAREPIHRELANLHGDDASVLKFVKRWGCVSNTAPNLTLRNSQELFVGPQAATAEALRVAHPESEIDWDTPVLFFEQVPGVLQLRDTLRKAWEGDSQAMELVQRTVEQAGSAWSFKVGRIEIAARDAWSAVCVLFLNDWAHPTLNPAICGNPNCLTPYFIRGRRNQKFCGNDECFAFAARERVSGWWNKHGNQWREQRRKKAKGKGRKK